jgi:hypothetical protein
MAVAGLQRLTLATLPPMPQFATAVLSSREPGVLTAVLVSGGVFVFAICICVAAELVRLYRRIALGVLLLSAVPNVAGAVLMPAVLDWRSSAVLLLMHLVV